MDTSDDRTLRILSLIESDADFLRINHYLEYLGYPIHAEHVSNIEELRSQLENSTWTVVISMSNITGVNPKDALSETKRINPDLPFILISGGIGEEEVADLMKAGAEDVVLVSRFHRLIQAVRRILRDSEVRKKEQIASKIAHDAYAAREQMLAVVSHDIKNPLSAIQLEAQMLIKVAERHGKSLLSEEVKIQAARILKTTDRLKALISDLLDRNKSHEGLASIKKDSVEAVKVFQEVVDANRPLIREKNIHLQTNFPRSCELLLDKNKMFQVLSNLVCNAIKFTPAAGQINLEIVDLGSVVEFSVQDNGRGLSPKDKNRVFEKYWTGGISGCSGTGLGLFICKTIVEAHGGHIKVDNILTGGSRFTFTIPKTVPEVEGLNWIQDQVKKILIIDDDDDLREVISWALSKEGFSVHSYRDPREALAGLSSGRHQPQLIVVDFHMEGMKGSEFLKHKQMMNHAAVSECPVVMISASPDEVALEVDPGLCQKILTKPLDLEGLVENIKLYLK